MVPDRKPRSYWRVAVAAVGWVILLAANQPEPAKEYPKPDPRVGDALSDISAALKRQEEDAARSPEKSPCKGGPEDHESDLCAQWTAANAAAQSAEWAKWATYIGIGSLVLSGIGLLALLKTLSQTDKTLRIAQKERASASRRSLAAADDSEKAIKIARENVEAAQAAVNETRRIGEAQVRAYMSFFDVQIRHDERTWMFIVYLFVENTGNSPAINIRTSGHLNLVYHHPEAGRNDTSTDSIPTSQPDVSNGKYQITIEFGQPGIAKIMVKDMPAIAYAIDVSGTDVFGNPWRGIVKGIAKKGSDDWITPTPAIIFSAETAQPTYNKENYHRRWISPENPDPQPSAENIFT